MDDAVAKPRWRPKSDLRPEMSPVFIMGPGWPSWQVANYTARRWTLAVGGVGAVIADNCDFSFVPAADVLPPWDGH